MIAKRHGSAQLDAHGDTWDEYFDQRYFHGATFRRAAEEGLIDPVASVQAVGMRGRLPEPDLDDGRALGFQVIPSEELRKLDPEAYGERMERVADWAVFSCSTSTSSTRPMRCRMGTPEVAGFRHGGDRLLARRRERARGRRRRGGGVAALRRPRPNHGACGRNIAWGDPRPAGGRMIARP